MVAEGGKQFYLEILARPATRKPRPAGEAAPSAEDGDDDDN